MLSSAQRSPSVIFPLSTLTCTKKTKKTKKDLATSWMHRPRLITRSALYFMLMPRSILHLYVIHMLKLLIEVLGSVLFHMRDLVIQH